jgi:hypothetical protein
VKKLFPALFAVGLAALLTVHPANAQVVWTYHNNNQRTGANLSETILTPANVNTNTFGKLFSYAVDGMVYAQPLYVPGVNIQGQLHNVVFIATEHNSVYAFDADNAGAGGGLLWQTNLGTSAVTTTANFTNTDFGTRNNGAYTDLVPEVGITGTPVIDTNSGTIYLDAFTHEGGNYFHRLHALSITNGMERNFSPVVVAASIPGIGAGSSGGRLAFNAVQQIQRAALTLAGGVVYAAYAGYADTNPYHGWVLGFDATNLLQLTNYIFNTTPNSTGAPFGSDAGEGGIWMGNGGLAADDSTNLFFQSGNGSFNATNGFGGTEYGDSFIKLSTANHLAVADYFTPYNQALMASIDLDLGSGGTMLLPDQPGPFPHLLVGAGKQGTIYLLDRDLMTTNGGHYDATNTIDFVLQSLPGAIGMCFDTPAYFNGKIYYAGSGDTMKIFSVSNGQFSPASPISSSSRTFGFPGATPSISANGTSNGIVWCIQYVKTNIAVLAACNATNLSTELYNSSQALGGRDQLTNGVKFAVPTIANGKVFVGGSNSVSVFGLFASLTPYNLWKLAHFGANANNPAIAGDLADPDSDHLANLMEYAFATDPNVADTNTFTGVLAGQQFQLHFRRNTSASDLTYLVQTSGTLLLWSNLITWTATNGWVANLPGASAAESATNGVAPDQFVDVTITTTTNVTAAGATNQFLRLQVHP